MHTLVKAAAAEGSVFSPERHSSRQMTLEPKIRADAFKTTLAANSIMLVSTESCESSTWLRKRCIKSAEKRPNLLLGWICCCAQLKMQLVFDESYLGRLESLISWSSHVCYFILIVIANVSVVNEWSCDSELRTRAAAAGCLGDACGFHASVAGADDSLLNMFTKCKWTSHFPTDKNSRRGLRERAWSN